MSDLPPPTPAGDLIRRVRELAIPKLSRPEVAHSAGIDPGTLGNIERGYRHLGNGRIRAVEGDAATIAKVARVLRIPPARLESEGQRPDAAGYLREILGTSPAADRGEDDALRQIREDKRLPSEWREAMIALAEILKRRRDEGESESA